MVLLGALGALLCCVSDGALAQVAQRGCRVSSLEIFRSHLNIMLGTVLWMSLLEQGLDQVNFKAPFPSQPFCGLAIFLLLK